MIEELHNYPLSQDEVRTLLKKHDITPTRQRLEIAQHLFQKQQHLSAEHILENVNALGATVSRATVYNTMSLFTGKGLVREVLIDRERVFYDSNSQPHHHLYNVDSGELSDVECSSQVSLADASVLPEGYRVVDTEVVIKISQK